jgi:hypothetical protein
VLGTVTCFRFAPLTVVGSLGRIDGSDRLEETFGSGVTLPINCRNLRHREIGTSTALWAYDDPRRESTGAINVQPFQPQ